MRLTLRSLLAYMDGILEPEDAEQIKQKLAASERATQLYHRLQDVVQRLRLSAPTSRFRGAALDANTVAEYLDNTLPADRVLDFEKVCLDSDVHLAEVACCHQILTLILGEPAEVDPALRERMYHLAEQAGQSAPAETAAADQTRAAPPPLEAGRKGRRKLAIPDYLREPAPRRRRWPWVAAVVVLVALVLAVLAATGQLQRGSWLDRLIGKAVPSLRGDTQPEIADARVGKGSDAAGRESRISQPPGVAQETSTATQPADSAEPAPTPPEIEQPGGPSEVSTAEPGPSAESPPAPSGTAQEGPEAEQPDQPSAEELASVEQPGSQPPGATESGTTSGAEAAQPGAGEVGQAVAEGAGKTGPVAVPVHTLGRMISEQEVLLRFSQARAAWQRVARGAELVAGDRVVAPPDYRPQIALTDQSGLPVTLVGGTQVSLLAPTGEEPGGMRVDFGRIVFGPTQQSAAAVRLAIGDHWGVIGLEAGGAVAAVEVIPVREPGADPETGPRAVQALLHCAAGRVTWQPAGASQAAQLSSPASLDLGAPVEQGLMAGEPYPAWVTKTELDPLRARGAANLAELLQSDRPAGLGLRELAEHRQKEVRWLAIRSLGYLGEFDPMVMALNDPDQQLDWPEYVDELRAAVNRTADSAAAVRRALEKRYDAHAAQMYRMLWGYTNADLEAGEDARLVRALEHPVLAVRVLAFWNLKDITGMGLFYRPEATPVKRRLPYQRWEERLKAGEIRIRPKPAQAAKPPEAGQ